MTMLSWDTIEAGLQKSKRSSIDDLFDTLKIEDGQTITVRLLHAPMKVASYWIQQQYKDRKDNKNKIIGINKLATNQNLETGGFTEDSCPYGAAYASRKYDYEVAEAKFKPKALKLENQYLVNAIVRELQDDEPKKKTPPTVKEQKLRSMYGVKGRFKEQESKTWTPVRVLKIKEGVIKQIVELSHQNLHVIKKDGVKEKLLFPVEHPRYGMEFRISYDSTKPAALMYKVERHYIVDEDDNRIARIPLTEEEQSYLMYDLTKVATLIETPEAAKKEWDLIKKKIPKDASVQGFLDGEDDQSVDGIDFSDMDDLSVNTGKKKKPATKRPTEEDDLDLDSLDLDLEEEDDQPVARKKLKPALKPIQKKPIKRPAPAYEDDEEEERPRVKVKLPPKKLVKLPKRPLR